jgi:hypothetical protein
MNTLHRIHLTRHNEVRRLNELQESKALHYIVLTMIPASGIAWEYARDRPPGTRGLKLEGDRYPSRYDDMTN